MIIGILKELKAEENRVAMTPAGVEVMIQNGHRILVEKDAGKNSGFADESYAKAGAEIVDKSGEIFNRSEMIMRVKEPQPYECKLIQEGQIYFAYLHLAASEDMTRAAIKSRSVCIAYETIQKANGSLPLLTPMSEVAGPMAVHEGAKYLEIANKGWKKAMLENPEISHGANVVKGNVTYKGVADAFGLDFVPIESVL